MIHYALKCENDHSFESWFRSAEDFDILHDKKMVECSLCGSDSVVKLLMAPAVRPARKAQQRALDAAQPQPNLPVPPVQSGFLTDPHSQLEQVVANLRKQIEENSVYVGQDFAAEARAMHEGESPERAIYGEAQPQEARALIEAGVSVAPLPFMPRRKVN
ncbi:MAG: hypothetical protein ACI9O0_001269 [Paracoccaceae bacterium]|jgi:hypothetical protein